MTTAVAQVRNQLDRLRDNQETREDYGTIIAAAAGTRVASKVLTKFVPSLAPMMPVIEIAGGALALKKAFELGNDSAAYLGAGVGLGISVADRFADTALAALDKFKAK